MGFGWRRNLHVTALGVLAAALFSCSEEGTPGDAAKGRGSPKKSVSSKGVEFQDSFHRIRIEAEDAAKIESDDAFPETGGKVMRIVGDPGASGGKCIEIPDVAGTPGGHAGDKPDIPRHARAVYKLKVEAAGNYTFWCRRKWFNACGDTLAVRFDKEGQPRDSKTEYLFGGSDSKPVRWAWSPVSEEGRPKEFYLTAGEHVMEILNLEDGPRFDVILLTDDPDYVAQGTES